jgi:peptide/nickel transport system ATP-binding protein
MPQEPPVLRVEHLTVRFCRRRIDLAAVNGVSFALARGETLTILGKSGSGKSVSLKALMGLPPAYAEIEGCIRLDGKDILDMPPGELAKLNGGEISMMRRALDLLDHAKIPSAARRLKNYPHELSDGMR